MLLEISYRSLNARIQNLPGGHSYTRPWRKRPLLPFRYVSDMLFRRKKNDREDSCFSLQAMVTHFVRLLLLHRHMEL